MTFEPHWTPVGAVDDFPEGRGKAVKLGHRRIGVYRMADGWYALKDICPHAGVALADGPVAAGAVMCVGHGWTFNLRDGAIAKGPGGFSVPTYPVRLRDGRVEIGL